MSKKSFEKHIENLAEEDLRKELRILHQKFSNVKDYYAIELGGSKDREKIYQKAIKEIAKKYLTKSYRKPKKPRIRLVNKLLKDLEMIAIFPHELIEVYLCVAKSGVKFLNHYFVTNSALNNSIVKNYEKACLLISEYELNTQWGESVQSINESVSIFHEIKPAIRRIYNNFLQST